MRIGIQYNGYPEKRNILNNENPEISFISIWDLYKIRYATYKLGLKLGKKPNSEKELFLRNSFKELPSSKHIEIVHLFNAVSYGKLPWISTFETILPRYDQILKNKDTSQINFLDKKAFEALASPQCKKIIAFSESTKKYELALLEQLDKETASKIENKIEVIYPPQKPLISEFKKNTDFKNNGINFIFVGRLFFVKGGLELLEVFLNIAKENLMPIKLHIVSSISLNDHEATIDYDESDIKKAKRLIQQNSQYIRHYSKLENKEVLELIKKCDVGLLPTFADTFGYSVLEMQACGVPVISTDIRALKEINNDHKGWLIHLPQNHFGEANYATKENRKLLREIVEKELYTIFNELIVDQNGIKVKGRLAFEEIKNKHSLAQFSKKMTSIYEEVLR